MGYFVNNTILLLYIFTIIYYVVLGCYMLAQRGNTISTRGEMAVKQRMTRSVGIFMLIGATSWMIYLPTMLQSDDLWNASYNMCFIFSMMMVTPGLFVVMHAIVQKKVNTMRWVSVVGAPFLILLILHLFFDVDGPYNPFNVLTIVIHLACVAFLLVRYASEYQVYVNRIRSEYSETTDREILWAWSCFSGFALQSVIFILYCIFWMPMLDIAYWAVSILNAAYLCYCTCRQKPLDNEIVEETMPDTPSSATEKEKSEEKAFYAVIEQKLESLCEDKLLFLEPDLTRETLCLRLSIGRTYLSMYFRSRGLTFYQYINTLRVDYAVKLMQENPGISIREVSELSGFRSQTTFRKMFQEVMGCLPSEVRTKKEHYDNDELTDL